MTSVEASIIIPVKDEPYISTLVSQIHKQLRDTSHEILVVYGDKSSSPPSVTNAKTHKIYGDSLETAILSGFSLARGRHIVVMDGDGSHPPSVIPKLLHPLNDGSDLTIATRFIHKTPTKMSPYRTLVSKTFAKLAQTMGGNSTDPMSGFFAFNKSILDSLQFKPFKWKVLYEILKQKGESLNITEIPYIFENRKFGASKTSAKMGLFILSDIFSGSNKLKIFLRLLLTVGLLGFLLYWMNVGTLIQVLLSIKLQYLALSVIIYVVMSSFMAFRLTNVLNIFSKTKNKFKDVFFGHTLGMLVSNITPAKIGYLASVPVLSKRTGIEKKGCLSAVLGIQCVELVVKALLATLSLIIIVTMSQYFTLISPALIGILTIASLGGVGLYVLWYKPYWLEDVPFLGDVAGYLINYPEFKNHFFNIAIISIFCWILRGLEWYFLGLSLGLSTPFYIFLILHPLLTAVRFLPLTPSSLGVFEIALIWGLSGFGITPETSFAFGLLDRFDNFPDVIAVKELLQGGQKS